ncbi:hypothetical protein DFH11DRAFT_1730473 [Phellopilus nigrolimitatus]|nr:hypothetical protein DFH11DRAFT_1730473 [Phellopilus nigrolimitatus]
MDFINKITHSDSDEDAARPGNGVEAQQDTKKVDAGEGFMGSVNNMLGGGKKGEANEEQAKDEAISDAIRAEWKKTTGSDFPVEDK